MEEFRKLVYNGITYDNFEISNTGQIRNLKTGKLLKHCISKTGYYFVSLSMGKRGKVKLIRLHKALAETFIPNPNPDIYNVVHHKDSNKLNYNLDNLEWTTSKINTQYHLEEAYKKDDKANNRKLSIDDVIFIRSNYSESNYSLSELGKMFNVSKTTILNIVHNIFYKEIA